MRQILTPHESQPFDRLVRKGFQKLPICCSTSRLRGDKAYGKEVNIDPISELWGVLSG